MNKSKLASGVVIALSLFALSACQQETAKPLTAEEKIVANDDHVRDLLAKAADINKPHIQASETNHNEGEIGPNMTSISFDGSSEDTFRADLEKFQGSANKSEISALNSALTYLKVFDLSARGNTAKLYQQLDGLTAEQIVERANKIKRK